MEGKLVLVRDLYMTNDPRYPFVFIIENKVYDSRMNPVYLNVDVIKLPDFSVPLNSNAIYAVKSKDNRYDILYLIRSFFSSLFEAEFQQPIDSVIRLIKIPAYDGYGNFKIYEISQNYNRSFRSTLEIFYGRSLTDQDIEKLIPEEIALLYFPGKLSPEEYDKITSQLENLYLKENLCQALDKEYFNGIQYAKLSIYKNLRQQFIPYWKYLRLLQQGKVKSSNYKSILLPLRGTDCSVVIFDVVTKSNIFRKDNFVYFTALKYNPDSLQILPPV